MHAARIRDEMEWSTRRLEIDTNLRMGEEQVLDKEQSTQRKLQNLQAVREEQQRTRAIEAELLVKRHAIATEDKSKSQLWRLEDEEAKQAWLMEEEARARKQRAQVMAADQVREGGRRERSTRRPVRRGMAQSSTAQHSIAQPHSLPPLTSPLTPASNLAPSSPQP